MVNIDPEASRLGSAFKKLNRCWLDTENSWDDKVKKRFEKEYMAPLEKQVRSTLREMERLSQVIKKAQRNVR